MAEITGEIVARPLDTAIEPEVQFDLTLSKRPVEVLIGLGGDVYSSDGKRLASLSILHESLGRDEQILEAHKYWDNARQNRIHTLPISAVSRLSEKAIDHLQNCRDSDPRNDVRIELRVNLTTIRAKTHVSPVTSHRLEQHIEQPTEFLARPHDPNRWSSNRTGDWLLSGDTSPQFLAIDTSVQLKQVRIPSNDWTHDFAPAFGIGRFMVVELPLVGPDGLPEELGGRIDRAISSIQDMEAAFRAGEWTEVVRRARPVVELVRDDDLWNVIGERTGYPEDALTELRSAVTGTFRYSSKFMHSTDQERQVRPTANAAKEDAVLVYTMSLGILNLIARKLAV